ncbi:cold-shock protein [Mucilaginibacter calamicampi]|uniref:Cold-shock protein n=1 Tax=Mucilaginibacter calamicampi TaxID=1302352 RepID=A0ABW2YR68_9SPHI
MATGTVKFFNTSKGFGFIVPDGGGKEVFAHVTGLIDEIREGDSVTYEVEDGKKGPSAVKVKLA